MRPDRQICGALRHANGPAGDASAGAGRADLAEPSRPQLPVESKNRYFTSVGSRWQTKAESEPRSSSLPIQRPVDIWAQSRRSPDRHDFTSEPDSNEGDLVAWVGWNSPSGDRGAPVGTDVQAVHVSAYRRSGQRKIDLKARHVGPQALRQKLRLQTIAGGEDCPDRSRRPLRQGARLALWKDHSRRQASPAPRQS